MSNKVCCHFAIFRNILVLRNQLKTISRYPKPANTFGTPCRCNRTGHKSENILSWLRQLRSGRVSVLNSVVNMINIMYNIHVEILKRNCTRKALVKPTFLQGTLGPKDVPSTILNQIYFIVLGETCFLNRAPVNEEESPNIENIEKGFVPNPVNVCWSVYGCWWSAFQGHHFMHETWTLLTLTANDDSKCISWLFQITAAALPGYKKDFIS